MVPTKIYGSEAVALLPVTGDTSSTSTSIVGHPLGIEFQRSIPCGRLSGLFLVVLWRRILLSTFHKGF